MSNILNTILLDRYRVDAFIGSGGMGVVYRVWDLKRNVPLAMKMLHADLAEDPHVFKRFEREARALQKLTHPNIIPFYGIYNAQDFAFILEQYVEGPSLNQYLKRWRGQALPMQEILVILRAMCAALGYAHSFDVIHCDVKPGNVLIDRGGSVYLTDFGIARHAESTNTTMAGIGTAGYMAPEQIRGDVVSPETDVYSLGIVLYEMLTGRRPFRGSDTSSEKEGGTANARVRDMQINQAPPDPRQFNPNISPDLAQVLLTAMAKNPDERFFSTQAFFNAVCESVGVTSEAVPERLSAESIANVFNTNQVSTPVNPPLPVQQAAPAAYSPYASPAMPQQKSWFKKWGAVVFAGGIVLVFLLILGGIGITSLLDLDGKKILVQSKTPAAVVVNVQQTVVPTMQSGKPVETAAPPTPIPPTKTPAPTPTPVVERFEAPRNQYQYRVAKTWAFPPEMRLGYWFRPFGFEGGADCMGGSGLRFVEAPEDVIVPGPTFGSTVFMSCGWSDNEVVKIELTYPTGEVKSEVVTADSNFGAILAETFGYGAQLGDYTLIMAGESGKLEHFFTVYPPDRPGMVYTSAKDVYFYGLVPGEAVVVAAYRAGSGDAIMSLAGWGEYTAEANGTLYIQNSVNAELFVGLADSTGVLKGPSLMDQTADLALKFEIPNCTNAPKSRLANSAMTRVIPGLGFNQLRSNAGYSSSVVGQIEPNEEVIITDGPVCASNMYWWQVISKDGTRMGWTSEGKKYQYWMEPVE